MKSIRSPLGTLLRGPLLLAVVGTLLWTLAACDDDPFAVTWVANQGSARLYSLDRPEVGAVSAFDFIGRREVVVESPGTTGTWDMALDEVDGQLSFITPNVLGIESEAGIAAFPDLTLDELTQAPADSAAYSILEPVPAEVGTVYVIRTRESRGRFSQLCLFYGKFEVTEVEPSTGAVQFVFDLNPDCDDRTLVPDRQPESGS
ncbi:MAG: hypothetical protein R3223_08925 [Longimicrobiales bacterium]|nr:hypothetical protein [Longimicrobiales bacterium]